MKIIADLHTHTNYSAHAVNTITEMINGAKERGLKAIALTDHGPSMPDSGHIWHFGNGDDIPKVVNGVVVLYGGEIDVMNVEGDMDLPVSYMEKLDWVIASLHKRFVPKLTFDEATQLWLNVAQKPYVDMIGHCEQLDHEFDLDKVIPAFAANNKVVEFNGNSVVARPGGEKNMQEIAKACKKYGCKVAINSDAHSMWQIARIQGVYEMLESIDFPQELIINLSFERLKEELKIHNKSIVDNIGD